MEESKDEQDHFLIREAKQRRPRPALFYHGLGYEVEDDVKKTMTQFSRRKVKRYERTVF